MTQTKDHFGPWRPDIEPAERLARLRSMRAIVRILTGPRGNELAGHLHKAEADASALVPALAALDRLAPLDRRKVLASYAGLARPQARPTSRATIVLPGPHAPRRPRPDRRPGSRRLAA